MKMSAEPSESLNQEMVTAAEEMLSDGFIEGLTIQLRKSFGAVADEADDASGHGVRKLITRSESPARPRDYVATCALNRMKRYGKSAARTRSLDALREPEEGEPYEPVADQWTVEEQALLDDVYFRTCRHVDTWETGNVRTVTLLYLEAAHLGEPLPSDEAAERLTEMLGTEIDPDFVRVWKSRGLKRLRAWMAEQGDEE